MKKISISIVLLYILFLVPACQPPVNDAHAIDSGSQLEKANQLCQEFLLVDTHIDLPYRIMKNPEDISKRVKGGHFDYQRAREGGLNVAFMAIYVAAEYQKTGNAKPEAEKLIDLVNGLASKWPEKYAVALSSTDVLEQFEHGLISLPMGMENGAPIEKDLLNLRHFYERGIRYITLCHSKWNQICDSSYDPDKHWNGLSPFGREVVREMNRLGIMIDISHVSDSTFYQVVELSEAPLVATHSSCRSYTPEFERNMSDDMIRALAAKGGVIQINFGSDFINGEFQQKMAPVWDRIQRENMSQEEQDEYREQYIRNNRVPEVSIEEVADHIDHVVDLAGIDYVGFGSDFDGVEDLPNGLGDVSCYPNLIAILLERGYSEEDLRKIMSGNFLRVWRENELIAQKLREKI